MFPSVVHMIVSDGAEEDILHLLANVGVSSYILIPCPASHSFTSAVMFFPTTSYFFTVL